MSDRLFYVLLPRFNMFSLTNLMEPARIANYLSVEDVYHKKYLSFDGPDITASNGMAVKLGAAELVEGFLISITDGGGIFSYLAFSSSLSLRYSTVQRS